MHWKSFLIGVVVTIVVEVIVAAFLFARQISENGWNQ